MNFKRTSFFLMACFGLLLADQCLAVDNRFETTHEQWVESTPAELGKTGVSLITRMPERQWWLEFNDSNLSHYVQTALDQNHSVQASLAKIAQARAQVKQAMSNQFPKVSVGMFLGRLWVPKSFRRLGIVRNTNKIDIFTIPFIVSYELDLWGKNWDTTKSARQELKAQDDEFKATETLVAAEVATAYFNMIRAEALYTLDQQHLSQLQELYDLKKSLYQNGLESLSAVLDAENEIGSKEIDLNQDQEKKGLAAHQLSILTGIEPQTLDQLPHTTLEQIALPSQIKSGLPLTTISQRPDIQAQEARLLKSKIDVRVARKMFLPTLRFYDLFGWASNRIRSLNGDNFYNLLLGNANQPLFQGGKILANLRLQQGALREQVETYRQTVLTALREVEDSLSSLRKGYHDQDSNYKEIQSREETLALTESLYQNGLDSKIDVLNAQNDLLTYREDAADIKADTAIATVNLYKALGGGF